MADPDVGRRTRGWRTSSSTSSSTTRTGTTTSVNWNGYQPPFTSINPDKLIVDEGRAPGPPEAVVTEEMFKQDLTPYRAAAGRRAVVAQRLDRDQGGSLTSDRRADRTDCPRRPRRRRRRRAAPTEKSSGAWYPRWYWPSFTVPGALWLLVLFVRPVLCGVLGRVRDRRLTIFRQPVPYYAPWWWSFSTFNDTLNQF